MDHEAQLAPVRPGLVEGLQPFGKLRTGQTQPERRGAINCETISEDELS